MLTITRGRQNPLAAAGLLGTGSDGLVVLDGTTTLPAPFGAPTAGVYTLTGDAHTTDCIVGASATLYTAGYILNALGTVSVAGRIHADGNSASAAFPATPGSLQLGGTMKPGKNGTAGTTGAGAAGGASDARSLGGASGTGGSGVSGAGAAVAAATAPTNAEGGLKRPRQLPDAAKGIVVSSAGSTYTYPWFGGSSGGSGAGDGTNKGGAGGNGGGLVVINCTSFVRVGSGSVTAIGGNGGSPTVGNCGGGAPGGGGTIIINCSTYAGAELVAATACAPGTPGSGVGTGTAGGAGSPGNVFRNIYT